MARVLHAPSEPAAASCFPSSSSFLSVCPIPRVHTATGRSRFNQVGPPSHDTVVWGQNGLLDCGLHWWVMGQWDFQPGRKRA